MVFICATPPHLIDRHLQDVPFFVSVQFPADVLRRPGLPAPGDDEDNGGAASDSDDSFTSEDWRVLDEAYDAAVRSGEIHGPKKSAKDIEKDTQFEACIAAEEDRVADEALAGKVVAAAEEMEAEAIREAIDASRESYARQMASFRELSVEPIPSGSRVFLLSTLIPVQA